MIFVTLGSQKFQFNRLLKEVDRLVEAGKITEEVYAQIGYSDYTPKNYKYKEFLDRDEFNNLMEKCDKVITHGGTGAIIGAVKNEKIVLAVPRLSKFEEHVDDHQLQIISEFERLKFIIPVYDTDELGDIIHGGEKIRLNKYVSNTKNIIRSISEYVDEN